MLISMAHAQEVAQELTNEAVAAGPSAASAAIWNIGMIFSLVFLFYFLLIRPQQKRFQEHKEMLDGLRKGDKIVTSGGLIGKIDKLVSDEEVIVDLGSIKVSAVRSTIQNKTDKGPTLINEKVAETKSKAKKSAAKKSAKKSPAKK